MKRIRKKVMPLFLALLILVGVPLMSYEEVKATGVEEYLYYTYWDLMNSVFAAQGYKMTVKDDTVKNHGVTGKQVWNNFKTWVKTNASKVYKEAVALPKAVTQEGIKMSQELWDAFKNYAAYCSSGSSNLYVQSQHFEMRDILNSVTGIDIPSDHTYAIDTKLSAWLICVTYNKYNGYPTYYLVGASRSWGTLGDAYIDTYGDLCLSCASANVSATGIRFSVSATGKFLNSYEQYNTTFSNLSNQTVKTLWRDGVTIDSNSNVYSLVSQEACPAEVPDVTPWIKNPAIPDEWRVVDPNEVPDPDDDNDGDAIPVVIPIKPNPDKPSETETEESTEKPDNDKEKDPGIIFNPSTGNQIDPNTGLDIDPDTGYLIDPDTGDLIDPNTGKKVDKNKIKNRVKNLPFIASGAGDITKYFPFCIPWDIVALIKTMNAQKSPPVFHFEHYFKAIDYNFVIDVNLEDYWKYIKIFRWGLTIFFIIGLFFLTDKLTTFVHKMVG